MIDKISIETNDMSLALPSLRRKVAFLSDIFRHRTEDLDFDFHSEAISDMFFEIETDIITIDEAFKNLWDDRGKLKEKLKNLDN